MAALAGLVVRRVLLIGVAIVVAAVYPQASDSNPAPDVVRPELGPELELTHGGPGSDPMEGPTGVLEVPLLQELDIAEDVHLVEQEPLPDWANL